MPVSPSNWFPKVKYITLKFNDFNLCRLTAKLVLPFEQIFFFIIFCSLVLSNFMNIFQVETPENAQKKRWSDIKISITNESRASYQNDASLGRWGLLPCGWSSRSPLVVVFILFLFYLQVHIIFQFIRRYFDCGRGQHPRRTFYGRTVRGAQFERIFCKHPIWIDKTFQHELC